MDLSGSYSCMSVNSNLSLVNSDPSALSVGRVFCLSVPSVYLSINLYPRSYHNLADRSYPHTAHARGALHNHYIGHSIKSEGKQEHDPWLSSIWGL